MMYAVLSDNARQAMITANRVAAAAGHEQITTAHVVLGLLNNAPPVVSQAFADLGVNIDALRVEVEASIAHGGDLAEATQLRRAIMRAVELKESMRDERVDCEHVLLGLLQENTALAVQQLANHGVSFDALKAALDNRRNSGR
jgi:ATP-dependent Clp protease ATP-binding subunit ClpA